MVQYVIEMKDLQVNGMVADRLRGFVAGLSNAKFSSNVVEKVFPKVCSRV